MVFFAKVVIAPSITPPPPASFDVEEAPPSPPWNESRNSTSNNSRKLKWDLEWIHRIFVVIADGGDGGRAVDGAMTIKSSLHYPPRDYAVVPHIPLNATNNVA